MHLPESDREWNQLIVRSIPLEDIKDVQTMRIDIRSTLKNTTKAWWNPWNWGNWDLWVKVTLDGVCLDNFKFPSHPETSTTITLSGNYAIGGINLNSTPVVRIYYLVNLYDTPFMPGTIDNVKLSAISELAYPTDTAGRLCGKYLLSKQLEPNKKYRLSADHTITTNVTNVKYELWTSSSYVKTITPGVDFNIGGLPKQNFYIRPRLFTKDPDIGQW